MIKSVFNRSLILCMLVGVLFASCKKEYDTPPIGTLPVGTVYSINDIIAMESGTVFTEDASVYGIVTDDEVSGNIYKSAYIQDRATGAALNLFLDATSGVRIGDSIRVYLKGVTYMMYNGLPQLSEFGPDGHIVILANQKYIEPAVATIEEIKAGKYVGGLVKLENVMFTEQTTFADAGTYGNRTLVDPSNLSQSVIVRTSNYANFAFDSLPQGPGSLIAIASVYGSTWQLLIRSVNELEFDNYNPGGGGGTQTLPYYQAFNTSFGSYTTYDVAGDQKWEIDYSTAKMAGYANSTNFANEDWLISAPVSFEGVSEVSMTMTYIARYFNNLNEDITVQVSADYVKGQDPTTATWTAVPASWTSGSDWTNFISSNVDLSQFAGQTVTVAVKYLSTDVKAGTIEVQSIVIQEGNGGGGGGGNAGEVQSLPYTQSFASEFGTYTTQDVAGNQSWMIDYSTAKMTGFENTVNYANEDWLISSPVALTGVNDVKLTMNYIARYFNSLNDDITIQVSSNYTYGDTPASATWTQVPATWVSAGNWEDFTSTEVGLSDFVGQTVSIAVKYLSTDTKAGTIEVKSITIEEGTAGGGGGGGGTAGGSGTADDPYNVASAIQIQGQSTTAWVEGYIVGCVKNGETTVSTNDQIDWANPFSSYTNVVIADNATENDIANCVIVNLPSGKPLRTQVNLFDNPENYGKTLAVLGTLRTYFGQAGLRDSDGTEASFVLEGGGVTPPGPGGDAIFSETFASGQGTFTIQDVVLPQELTYVWNYASQYSCMKASAFVSQAFETESWLVSPSIDLSAATSATLTFDNAVNYHTNPNEALSIMVSTDYSGDVQNATWTEVSLSAWPAGSDWTFVSSNADLSSFAGQSITVAFKYTSTTSVAATWEVKNLVIE